MLIGDEADTSSQARAFIETIFVKELNAKADIKI